jgi:hypothetical protein
MMLLEPVAQLIRRTRINATAIDVAFSNGDVTDSYFVFLILDDPYTGGNKLLFEMAEHDLNSVASVLRLLHAA